MNEDAIKKSIIEFLGKHKLAILSTVNKKGTPDAAPIYFVSDENLNCFFITPVETQKYFNLKTKNQVVLTITDEENRKTVQIRGKATEKKALFQEILSRLAEKMDQEMHFEVTLPLLKYKDQKKTVIAVKPQEIRLRNFNKKALEEKILKIKS